MDNQPKFEIFSHPQFGKIATTVSEDDEILFKANDVAKALGYKAYQNAVTKHCEGVTVLMTPSENQHGTVVMQPVKYIPEYEVYALIFGSKLPAAKEFRRWVYRDVLPSIRKHGAYIAPSILDRIVKNPSSVFTILKELWDELDIFKKKEALYIEQQSLVEEQSQQLQTQATAIEVQGHAIMERDKEIYGLRLRTDFTEEFKATQHAIDVTEIAQPYGLSACELNKILWDFKIQRPLNGRWMPNKAYAHLAKTTFSKSGAVLWTQWYPEGVMMIYELLRSAGYKTKQEKDREANLFNIPTY